MHKIHPKNGYSYTSTDQRLKIAVVGSGISGIASAWFLSEKHDVTLYEKNDYLGGHTHTVEVEDDRGKTVPIDTGFIVYNEPNYPHLTAMLKHLKVETQKTDMSFSVSIDQGRLEYAGNNLNTLFAQRKNLFSLSHWGMISEIVRFNRVGKNYLNKTPLSISPNLSLGGFLKHYDFSSKMIDCYLLPMAAAIWSCPTDTMKSFPAKSFLRFFENHGLLNVSERPQWETIKQGSHQYLKTILNQSNFSHLTNQLITDVKPLPDQQKVRLTLSNGQQADYDQVIMASHGIDSFHLIDSEFQPNFQLLSAFKYQKNIAYLHSDEQLMPVNRNTWASWNYLRNLDSAEDKVAVSYWMNQLQSLETNTQFFVTLNPLEAPNPQSVKGVYEYDHPIFDLAAIKAQKDLETVQGLYGLWFCGAYTGFGFHEDGLRSAVNIAHQFGLTPPWENAKNVFGIRHA